MSGYGRLSSLSRNGGMRKRVLFKETESATLAKAGARRTGSRTIATSTSA